MVVELVIGEMDERDLVDLLRPEPTADGFESAKRLIIRGFFWDRYLALDRA